MCINIETSIQILINCVTDKFMKQSIFKLCSIINYQTSLFWYVKYVKFPIKYRKILTDDMWLSYMMFESDATNKNNFNFQYWNSSRTNLPMVQSNTPVFKIPYPYQWMNHAQLGTSMCVFHMSSLLRGCFKQYI